MHMKHSLIISVLFFLITAFAVPTNITDVIRSINNGDASAVANYFDNSVEIVLPNTSSTYSKSQAEMVLKDFISLNGIKGFNLLHKGENAGSEYFIGQMPGKVHSFRVTVFLKQKEKGLVVQEIRFENN